METLEVEEAGQRDLMKEKERVVLLESNVSLLQTEVEFLRAELERLRAETMQERASTQQAATQPQLTPYFLKQYDDGTYLGETNERHGKGLLQWSDSEQQNGFYFGEWKNNEIRDVW